MSSFFSNSNESFTDLRYRMVRSQLQNRGIVDQSVIQSMGKVPREEFVSKELRQRAYEDNPLNIDCQQTISQPYIVAYMLQALQLQPSDRVLDVGTGSGYNAAALAEIVKDVYTIERHDNLSKMAQDILQRLGYQNIHFRMADGVLGWSEAAPYQAIVVAATAPKIPQAWKQQLAMGGRLVMPLLHDGAESLIRVIRISTSEFKQENLCAVRFVPCISDQDWEDVL